MNKATAVRTSIAIAAILIFSAGCDDGSRLRKAQAEAAFWQVVALTTGAVALCSILLGLRQRSHRLGGSENGGDPDRGDGPDDEPTPPSEPWKPRHAQSPSAPDQSASTQPTHQNGTHDGSLNGTPQLPGVGNRTVRQVTASPERESRWDQDYFVLDGLNICISYHSPRQFRLETLLCLTAEILRRGARFECHFDASTRYRAAKLGSEDQREAYESLLKHHSDLFAEAPAGESADDSILLRADLKSCPVISNDRFSKLTDRHLELYPWLASKGRRIPGREFQGELIVSSLGLVIPIEPDLTRAMGRFESALNNFTAQKHAPLPLAT